MKQLSWRNVCLSIFSGALLLLIAGGLAQAQSDDLRRSLFKEADAALKAAEEREASVYAPNTFVTGMTAYKKAEEELQKGDELKEIQKKLAVATESFTKSVDLTQRSTAFFASVIKARQEARQAEAGRYAQESWERAESRLGDAIKALEAANDSSARAKGVEAETAYREAELDSVKSQCLGEARALLAKAEEAGVKKHAPLTLEKAAGSLQKAEKALEENRRNTEEARKLASQAQYETAHAMYLSQAIGRLSAEKKTMEQILLEAEAPLQTIANALGKTVRFDQGIESAAKELAAAAKTTR